MIVMTDKKDFSRFEDNKRFIEYLIVNEWISTIKEIINKVWMKFNNLEEKWKLENDLQEYLEKENLTKYLDKEKKQTKRNYWQFKDIIKELVLEWKNSIEILEELWYNTWFFDQRSLQQYVRKYLWLNITKRTNKWIKLIEKNRFKNFNKEELEKFVLESKNLNDLYSNIWINENNKRLRNELFERLDELNIDYSNLKWRSSVEWSYNFMNHIDTIKECLKEWKDLSEILNVIWIEETQHSRKLLRKFIKNKERLMKIKLETTWKTYYEEKFENYQDVSQYKYWIKYISFYEYQKNKEKDWYKNCIFWKLDVLWKDKIQELINQSNYFNDFREKLQFQKTIKFKQLKPYFDFHWINSENIEKNIIDFEDYHEQIKKLSLEWKTITEILTILWIEKTRHIKESLKFYSDTNNISIKWILNLWFLFTQYKEKIIEMIKQKTKKKDIVLFLFEYCKDLNEINIKWKLLSKLNTFIEENNLEEYYQNLSTVYVFEKEKLEEVCEKSDSYVEAIEMYWYQYNINSKSHFKKAIVRYWIDISHFRSVQIYWNQDFIQIKQKLKLKKKTNVYNNKINSLIQTFCVWSKKLNSTVRHLIKRYWLLENKCEICWLSWTYNWKDIVLQVDHIDWDDHNHSLSNLRYLCPNCHSQTETFCHRNVWTSHKPYTWKVDETLKKFLDKQFPWWSDIEEFKKYL